MYGIKEIKKHMKLKKLKGIIIATDIEDNKAEGNFEYLEQNLKIDFGDQTWIKIKFIMK